MANCSISTEMIKLSERVLYTTYHILLPPYLLIGMASNLILLIAFYKHSKKEDIYIYQVLLTISKMLEVITFSWYQTNTQILSGYMGQGVAWFQRQYVLMVLGLRVGSVLGNHLIISSLLLTVAMAADRVFALALPLRYRKINHPRRATIAAIICFALPATASLGIFWFYKIVPVENHFEVKTDERYWTFPLSITSRLSVIIRFVALCLLVILNILMVRCFRKRTIQAAAILNVPEQIQARKELDKTIMMLNVWQSILMLNNQFPHIWLYVFSFLAPNVSFCYAPILLAPISHAFLFITDTFDLPVIWLINDYLLQAYADDLALLVPAKAAADLQSRLQPALDYIANFIFDSSLAFNVDKTQAMMFWLGKLSPPSPVVSLCGQQLKFLESVKYLGITLTPNLHFSDHCRNVAKKARRMVGAFQRRFGKFTRPVLQVAYKQCILPVLDYGCSAWAPLDKGLCDDLERSQKFAVRCILNDWNIDYEVALRTLQFTPLASRRDHLKLLQFYKFYHGYMAYPNSRLIHLSDSGRRVSQRRIQSHKIITPRPRTETYKQSFLYSSLTLWNALDSDVALSALAAFRVATVP